MKTCSIEGCDSPVLARGWCGRHYARWRYKGDPLALKTRQPTAKGVGLAWLKAVVSVETDDCLEWPFAARHVFGYGQTSFEGKQVAAHQVALIFSGQHRPFATAQALHSCDNPPCCNVRHLRWGTAVENMRDMAERHRSTQGERHSAAKLTETQVLEIRELVTQPDWPNVRIAEKFGVSQQAIWSIRVGNSWAYLGPISGAIPPKSRGREWNQ